jgi:GT2 family glycosyltransferase
VPVLGFLACAAVARRLAYLETGGFHPRFGVGGEEKLVALDLAAAGWRLAYVPDVVAHHRPPPRLDGAARRRRLARNAFWCAWLRRPLPGAARQSAALLRLGLSDRAVAQGLAEALAGAGWVLRERRPLSRDLERQLARLGDVL